MKASFWIDPHGCAKNDVDAENMVRILEEAGYPRAPDLERADVVIVNSCGFIESAKRESIEAVIDLKAAYPGKKVVLAGCLSQRYSAELSSDLGEADGIFGNGDLRSAPEFMDRLLSEGRTVMRPERAPDLSGGDRSFFLSGPGSAYVKPTEGCSNHCSFCAIPLIRGELSSRPMEAVRDEAVALRSRGIFEINLVGQDLGSYGRDLYGRPMLPELVSMLAQAAADAFFRVLYIHPDHFPEPLLDVMAREPRVFPYFDIPFQHGSPRILSSMGRKGDPGANLALVERIRRRLPDAVIRSTFMLGYPGEEESDFEALTAFMGEARLDWAGFFCYSREEDTPASLLKGRVGKKAAQARKKAAEAIQEELSAQRLERFVGRELDVLVEENLALPESGGESLSLARAYLQAPEVDGLTVLSGEGFLPGDLVRCRVMRRAGLDLSAVGLKVLRRSGAGRA
jgi:ribosomal protein S12 methylthiotransferase